MGLISSRKFNQFVLKIVSNLDMVSFSCEVCNDTVIKKKLDQHAGRCYGAYFSCIDCSTTFSGTDYRNHTSCISEAEKYEKALYKGPKVNKKVQNKSSGKQEVKQGTVAKKVEETNQIEEPKKIQENNQESKKQSKKSKSKSKSSSNLMKYVDQELNLYKIVKKVSKDNSQDIKEVLKSLTVMINDDGKLMIQ